VIRVWIKTSSAFARAGFESLLEDDANIALADSASDADVILTEELPNELEPGGSAPMVVLAGGPFKRRAFQLGVRAILPLDAGPQQIVAALWAAAAGLMVVPADPNSPAIATGNSEAEIEALTPREIEVLDMLGEGLSNKQVAARLSISEHTAKFHVNSILGKFHVGTRTEAVMHGIRSGLVKV